MTVTANNSKQRRRNWAWTWFAYTGFLFIRPIRDPSLYLWLGTIAAFTLFLGIFIAFVRSSDEFRPARLWMIAATFALGLLCFPWNQGSSTFFVYAAAFLPFSIVSIRRILSLFVLEALLILVEGYVFHAQPGFLHVSWPDTFVAIFLMSIIGAGNIFVAQQKRADGRLREAQDENLALAAVAERERIARDLHDVLGHTLSVIVLKSELASRLIARDAARDHQHAATEIADVERIARTALTEVREAITGYRSRGLDAEIEAARLTLDAAGVKLIVGSLAGIHSLPSGVAHLSAAEETALALALREAVTNIVRHARATTCRLLFITEDGRRRLVVEDDGEHAIAREGNGLRGMRERIESIGGRLFLERDYCTRLLIELPLRSELDPTPAASS